MRYILQILYLSFFIYPATTPTFLSDYGASALVLVIFFFPRAGFLAHLSWLLGLFYMVAYPHAGWEYAYFFITFALYILNCIIVRRKTIDSEDYNPLNPFYDFRKVAHKSDPGKTII